MEALQNGSHPEDGSPRRPGGTDAEPLRVILVGRTGLDSRLRADPAIELVRVRTRLDAVGELAERSGPARAVVVVGSDTSEPTPSGFAEALRRVDPAVRVVAAGPDVADEIGWVDAVVMPDAGAELLRSAVRGAGRGAVGGDGAGGTTREPDAPEDPLIEIVTRGRVRHHEGEPAEGAILEAMIQGRDPTPALIAELRRRAGAGVEFVEGAAAEGAGVVFAGRRLGALRAPGASDEALARHGAWLGPWLALRDQHAQLREAAFIDVLTGAYNRRFFERFLSTAIERARRDRRTVTLLVFDLDDFKTYNDRYGHMAGDEILRETVRLMRSVIRPSDRVCRIGGDEFAVIFHEPDGPRTPTSRPPTDVFQIAERFQQAVRDARFPKLGAEAPGTLTISGGLASFPWDGHSPEELLRRADELALQSKREGKNAIRIGPETQRGEPG